MIVPFEVLGMIVTAAGIVVTIGIAMFAGFAWVVRRIDAVDTKLTDRIDAMGAELTEVKIAVARLEGPRPHLIVGR
ncbi:hypothetical protein GCM10025768_05120 [Microbacterium pseudoresistens]|uniref:Uncharacterized protein n=1 Tax=Microbacterium pseudoresistens TaxID=640634 RepID=A0A7Y9EV25_9MICO|nr:hypothetical protein [Microbacterium pseudoresistens]